MARTSELTQSAVSQVCRELFAAGQSVSFAKVYVAIGSKGSGKIVHEMIRKWRAETGDMLAVRIPRSLPGVPDELVANLDSLLLSTWQMSLDQADQAYTKAREQLAEERVEVAATLEIARAKLAQAELENVQLIGELNTLRAAIAGSLEANQDLQNRLSVTSAQLAAREEQLGQTREDLASALTTIDAERSKHEGDLAALRDRHAQDLTNERALGEEKLAQAAEKHQAALALSDERAAADRSFLMQQTDEIRSAAKVKAEHLQEQLENARATAESHRQAAYAARDEASKWQGQAEILKQNVAVERSRAASAEQRLMTQATLAAGSTNTPGPSNENPESPEN